MLLAFRMMHHHKPVVRCCHAPAVQPTTARQWLARPSVPLSLPFYNQIYCSLESRLTLSSCTNTCYHLQVRCELCFDTRRVTFWVNGRQAGSASWGGQAAAYPAVSVFPGDLVCEVAFD